MSAVLQESPQTGDDGGIEVTRTLPGQESLLTPAALAFLAGLHRRFEGERRARLAARAVRQVQFDAGALPDFRADTAAIRNADWTVAPIPAALHLDAISSPRRFAFSSVTPAPPALSVEAAASVRPLSSEITCA